MVDAKDFDNVEARRAPGASLVFKEQSLFKDLGVQSTVVASTQVGPAFFVSLRRVSAVKFDPSAPKDPINQGRT